MLGRHSAGRLVHDVLAIPTRRWSQEKEKALVPSGRCHDVFSPLFPQGVHGGRN